MNETNYAGKLYARLGGAFVDTGWHTDDVDKLTADVKRLEAENQRLKCLFRFACEVLARNDCELDAYGHKIMIERLYDDTQAEAQ
jgi:hypothetical protein